MGAPWRRAWAQTPSSASGARSRARPEAVCASHSGDVLANDARAVALVDVVGTREDTRLDAQQLVVFEFESGELREARFVYEVQAAYDSFWS